MDGAGRWGSSEYSTEAEELFAGYLASGADLGAAFETFCEQYPDHEDELIGLRADWDNVRGVLGELGLDPRRMSAAAPEPVAAAPASARSRAVEERPRRPAAAAPSRSAARPPERRSAQPEPATAPDRPATRRGAAHRPAAAPSGSSRWPSVGLAALGALALALGAVGLLGWRESRALAAEKRELLAQTERERQESLEQRAALEREQASLRERTAELEREAAEAERAAAREARRAAQLADWRELEALEDEAAGLWPAVPGRASALEAWLERARGVLHRRSASAGQVGAGAAPVEASASQEGAVPTDPAAPALLALLERFGAPRAGLVARVERRLAVARGESELPGLHAAWSAAAQRADSSLAALSPRAGLAPIGRDEASGRWELAFLPAWDEELGGGASGARRPLIVLFPVHPEPAEDEMAPGREGFFLSTAPLPLEAWRRLGCPPPLVWRALAAPGPAACRALLAAAGLRLASAEELRAAGLGDAAAGAPRVARSLDG